MNNKNHAPAVSMMADLRALAALLHLQDNLEAHGHSFERLNPDVGAPEKNCPV